MRAGSCLACACFASKSFSMVAVARRSPSRVAAELEIRLLPAVTAEQPHRVCSASSFLRRSGGPVAAYSAVISFLRVAVRPARLSCVVSPADASALGLSMVGCVSSARFVRKGVSQ